MNRHSMWLQWKLKNGLAIKGRAAGIPLKPTNMLARFLAKHFIKGVPAIVDVNEIETLGRRVFKQNTGGTVGAAGGVKGLE